MYFCKIFQINNFLPNKLSKTSIFDAILIALFRKYAIYYATVLLLITFGLSLLLVFPKGELVLFLDSNSTPFLDNIFLGVTAGGEFYFGLFIFILLLALGKKRCLMLYLISILLTIVVSQGLKRVVFEDEKRPATAYSELRDVHGMERHLNNSFPSGHTTAAFTFITVLVLAFEKKIWIQLAAPIFASAVGFSRVYLGQHYLSDIVAGAVLGVFIVSVVAYFLNQKWSTLK